MLDLKYSHANFTWCHNKRRCHWHSKDFKRHGQYNRFDHTEILHFMEPPLVFTSHSQNKTVKKQ